jgi:hypothetical protein
MRGARKYHKYFHKGQYDRLYIYPGSHARGKTFHIYVLPEGVKAKPNEAPWTINGAVEVYGVLGGFNGWTEYYGWLHKGKWQEDFESLYKKEVEKYEADAKKSEEDMAFN